MNAVEESAISFYLSKGLSKDIAVGIVAVLCVESALNPGSQGAQSTETPGALNPSGAYGVASWNGVRQASLQAFANAKALPVASLDTQLAFVLTESANSYPKVWAAMTGPAITYQNFIPIFVDGYETPKNEPSEIAKAVAFAEDFYPNTISVPAVGWVAPSRPAPVSPAPVFPSPGPATLPAASVGPPLALTLQLIQSLTAYVAANMKG